MACGAAGGDSFFIAAAAQSKPCREHYGSGKSRKECGTGSRPGDMAGSSHALLERPQLYKFQAGQLPGNQRLL
jgi:hypothetical protein